MVQQQPSEVKGQQQRSPAQFVTDQNSGGMKCLPANRAIQNHDYGQKANFSFKLTISQSRKQTDKNYAKYFLWKKLGMKVYLLGHLYKLPFAVSVIPNLSKNVRK